MTNNGNNFIRGQEQEDVPHLWAPECVRLAVDAATDRYSDTRFPVEILRDMADAAWLAGFQANADGVSIKQGNAYAKQVASDYRRSAREILYYVWRSGWLEGEHGEQAIEAPARFGEPY